MSEKSKEVQPFNNKSFTFEVIDKNLRIRGTVDNEGCVRTLSSSNKNGTNHVYNDATPTIREWMIKHFDKLPLPKSVFFLSNNGERLKSFEETGVMLVNDDYGYQAKEMSIHEKEVHIQAEGEKSEETEKATNTSGDNNNSDDPNPVRGAESNEVITSKRKRNEETCDTSESQEVSDKRQKTDQGCQQESNESVSLSEMYARALNEIKKLESQRNLAYHNNSNLENTVLSKLREEIKELERKNEYQEKRIEFLSDRLLSKNGKIWDLEKQLDQHKESSNETLEEIRKKVKEIHQTRSEEINQTEKQISGLKNTINNLKDTILEKQQVINSISQQIEVTHNKTKTKIDTLNNVMKSEISKRDNMLSNVLNQNNLKDEELKRLKDTIEILKEQLHARTKDNQLISAFMMEKSKQIQTLNTRMDHFINTTNRTKANGKTQVEMN